MNRVLVVALALGFLAPLAPPAAQSRTGAPGGPVPRHPNGRVDISGLWQGGGPIGDIAEGLPKGETIPLLPQARQVMEARRSSDDPQANCLPSGVPRIAPYPWRIVETPTHIFFLFEANIHSYRQIFMDGRSHPPDLDPTWYGHSIGRWDGDTLVVDTVGFNDRFWFDFKGHPHTERLHVIERYTRTSANVLVNDITIDDPGAYERLFTVRFTAETAPDGDELMEYICSENNQDLSHLQGPTGPPGDPSRTLGTLGRR